MAGMLLTIAMWTGGADNPAGFVPTRLYATLTQPMADCEKAPREKLGSEWNVVEQLCVASDAMATAHFLHFHCEVSPMPEGSPYRSVAECPAHYP